MVVVRVIGCGDGSNNCDNSSSKDGGTDHGGCGDGDGNTNDATAVDGEDVDEDNGGDSRMAIGRQRWDNVDVGC